MSDALQARAILRLHEGAAIEREAVRDVLPKLDAAASPLYRAILDNLETHLAERSRQRDTLAHPCAEASLRAFLECGIPRFGVARFLCKDCGDSRFVPFSCKRRMACPSDCATSSTATRAFPARSAGSWRRR